ncbi:PREDICTED: putative RING-H2 finger protein ATL37 [Camelina sativa]|uniref:RING-H2 finger protein ATL37 n=1 Tax=Camelina sativa TaxID=90675 RepID=A0ABM0VFC1_CAMSA|nr:PREDICTED: putative RING-H2 finger protein ATL37 [Camelina sativa]
MDVETGNAQRGVQEHPNERNFTGNSVAWNNNANYGIPRSRSTGLPSSWQIPEIFFPRSYSTGHSLVQLGENLDRFKLLLPEEVHRQLVSLKLIRRSHMALPQAMSSRQGYRSGNERSGSSLFLFSTLGTKAPRSTHDRNDKVRETSEGKNNNFGERSFQRLMPENVYFSPFKSSISVLD